jgi:ribulose-phosphate 3-epimerase
MPVHKARALIGPSLLAADMSCLAEESKRVLTAGADYLHLDVMDGHFVPNLTFGAPVITSLRKHVPGAILDVHLMVSEPWKWVDDMKAAGADVFTFHVEVLPESGASDHTALVHRIKATGMKVGMAVKPGTPIEALFPYGDFLDQVLVMTVEPGFGGQKFMHDMMGKVSLARSKWPEKDIQVDGGLAVDTIDVASQAGANMIVAGSAVFKGNPAEVISVLRRSIERHGHGKEEGDLSPLR